MMSNFNQTVNLALAMLMMFATGVQARTWTSTDGSKIQWPIPRKPTQLV